MHRAISGDLQNEDEMERAMEDSGDEEGIYRVRKSVFALEEKLHASKTICSQSDDLCFIAHTWPVW